jgi:hypothetical protein
MAIDCPSFRLRNQWDTTFPSVGAPLGFPQALWDIIGDYWTPSIALIQEFAKGNLEQLGHLLNQYKGYPSGLLVECPIKLFYELPLFQAHSDRNWRSSKLIETVKWNQFPCTLVPSNMGRNVRIMSFQSPEGNPGLIFLTLRSNLTSRTHTLNTYTAVSFWQGLKNRSCFSTSAEETIALQNGNAASTKQVFSISMYSETDPWPAAFSFYQNHKASLSYPLPQLPTRQCEPEWIDNTQDKGATLAKMDET